MRWRRAVVVLYAIGSALIISVVLLGRVSQDELYALVALLVLVGISAVSVLRTDRGTSETHLSNRSLLRLVSGISIPITSVIFYALPSRTLGFSHSQALLDGLIGSVVIALVLAAAAELVIRSSSRRGK